MTNLFIQQYGALKKLQLKNSPYSCLKGSNIDINPHQIEAFCAAVASLKSGGIILADEVGLGKTIEAGLVLKFVIQNGAKRILLVMPSNLRKQWQIELEEKFNIDSIIVDSFSIDEYNRRLSNSEKEVVVAICSYSYAARRVDLFSKAVWDLVIFDEAHKLRNVYKSSLKTAKRLYELTKGIPKVMLTATPLQNHLFDLFGIVQFIDERIFFDKRVFSKRYIKEKNYEALKEQINPVIQRTLRKDVSEYLSFKERICVTVDFKLSPEEAILYKLVNDYLKRDIIYSIPSANRNLMTIVVRKLLASSSHAIIETFEVLKSRLLVLKESTRLENVEKGLDYFFDFIDDDSEDEEEINETYELYDREKVNEFIQYEIDVVDNIIKLAMSIHTNQKATALLNALKIAFERQKKLNIDEKAVVFTESVRTQEYLYKELSKNGYENEILLFSGNTSDKFTNEIYKAWKVKNYGKTLGSRNTEIKHAIVDYFKNNCKILILTDAGSEGLNLQLCNSVINYDLPWNPQKIEQRIGRCHRYGQKNDTVVLNLLNTENIADKRVYEILSVKFMLFEGVFGASDQAIGLLESGMDFEKRVLQIYQCCDSVGEFNKEFKDLEREFDRKRNVKFQQLKSIFTAHDSVNKTDRFRNVLFETMSFIEEYEKWMNLPKSNIKVTYPAAFSLDLSNVEVYGLNHGYIFIGGFYDKDRLLYTVLDIFDKDNNRINLDEKTILNIISVVDDSKTTQITINENELKKCADEIYSNLMLKYYSQIKEIIEYNNIKVENWSQIRKEQLNIEIESLSTEIDVINRKVSETRNFKEKIEFKKQAEQKAIERKETIVKYHTVFEAIDREATEIKNDFKKQFEINPFLLIRVIIKF